MKKYSRTIVIVLLVVLIGYFLLLLFSNLSDGNISTETVIYSSYSDYLDISGIALRNEKIISADSDSVFDVVYNVEDGDRVSVGSVVATYNTEDINDSSNKKIRLIDNKISEISDSISTSIFYDTDSIDTEIKSRINSILWAKDKSSYTDLLEKEQELQILFNKKDIVFNDKNYYTEKLKDYNNEKESLISLHKDTSRSAISGISGYFCANCDGYEYLSPNDFLDISVEKYETLKNSEAEEISPSSIGKIQKKSSWYFVSLLDTVNLEGLSVGGNVNIEIDYPNVGKKTLPFSVLSISNSVNGKSAVVFKCDTANNATVSIRKTTARLMKKSYNGFKINNNSLRIVDGKYGVYVVSAQRIVFKPVDIVYSSEEFTIVTSQNGTSRSLSSKDEVIIGGKNLYDGKIVNLK